MSLGDDVGVAVTVTHANTGIQCLYPCVDLPFDDPVEAVERTFEATETQFVVRARRQAALDALADRKILRQGTDGDVVVLAPVQRGLGAAQALQAQGALVDAGKARSAVRNALERAAVVPGPGVLGADKAAPTAARYIDQPGAAMEPTEIRPLHRETEPAPGELELGDPARPQLRPVSA